LGVGDVMEDFVMSRHELGDGFSKDFFYFNFRFNRISSLSITTIKTTSPNAQYHHFSPSMLHTFWKIINNNSITIWLLP
jgi:hypothetical protein